MKVRVRVVIVSRDKLLAADVLSFLEKGYRVAGVEVRDDGYEAILEPRIEDVGDSCE